MRHRSEVQQIESVASVLSDEFELAGQNVNAVRGTVAREYWRYKGAPVRAFVPTLVHRRAREALRHSGREH